MARLDPHSYADSTQPQVHTLELRIEVNFTRQVLEGAATLLFDSAGQGPLDLDTRELTIDSVESLAGQPLEFTLAPAEPILGAKLTIDLPPESRGVRVVYRTSSSASALQWLDPAQTEGKQHPFLFSQCQAIHARSVVPLQDTPRVRIRYRAELTVPSALTSVMGAASRGRQLEGAKAVDSWEMPQPIPPYLLAFAVGELASAELGPRSRVWAEPSMLARAAYEFAEIDPMFRAAEALFGPYDWERFDLLTLPSSFPYGGMENPRLTFLTPTLIAGDRSLVAVVAHELAHSWTGNLVTNANAEHFWLNEGMTVFAERRIIEAVEGEEVWALHAALGRRELEEALAKFAKSPGLTRLRTHLQDIDPDEAFSVVPYEKGYLFLRTLEQAVGRERFDAFLKTYLKTFRFRSVTTDDFLELAERELPGVLEKVGAQEWIDGEGIPANAPPIHSSRLQAIERLHDQPPPEQAKQWTPTEWQLFLDQVPRPASVTFCEEIETRFHLNSSSNYEILVGWLLLAAASGYAPAMPRIEEVLSSVGRMKYLKPLYLVLAEQPATRALALRCFERSQSGYHPIARQGVKGILEQHSLRAS